MQAKENDKSDWTSEVRDILSSNWIKGLSQMKADSLSLRPLKSLLKSSR